MTDSTSQHIEKGGFSGTTGAHDGIDFSGLEDATDVLEDGFIKISFFEGKFVLIGLIGDFD
jgi:hypothetical protein